MEKWRGRKVLVTGASSGIGAVIAKRLSREGMIVIGCARNVAAIQELAKEHDNIIPIQCDLRKEEQILAMFERIREETGGLDVCINNAGVVSQPSSLLEGDTEKWREIFEVNSLAPMICTREAVKMMREKGVDDGHIFNISSIMAHKIYPIKITNAYTASKFALRAIAEGLRNELREIKSHIRSTSIYPGVVDTGIVEKKLETTPDKLFNGLKEYLKPEDIADSVVYALSAPPHVQLQDIIIMPTQME